MNCVYVHTWLMQVDSLLVKDWPRDMNRHLKQCAACAKLARSLFKLEASWRDIPVPEECEQAKVRFLKSLPAAKPAKSTKPDKQHRLAPSTSPKPAGRPWHPIRWIGAAAMVLIAVTAFAWLLFSPTPSRAASSDIVERLIDWNVALTNADADERKRLLQENEPKLREDLAREKPLLTAEDAKIAEDLLETGCWLAMNDDDPVAEAERITEISDKLYDRAAAADKKGNEKEKERCAWGADKFRHEAVRPMQKALTPLFMKFSQFKLPDPKKGVGKGGFDKAGPDKGGFDKGGLEKAWNQKKKELEKIWDRAERSRIDLHRKFDGFHKKGPSKFGGKR